MEKLIGDQRLKCKCCGSYSMTKMTTETDEDAEFWICQVCGDNWMGTNRLVEGTKAVSFVHQVGHIPALTRNVVFLKDHTVENVEDNHWNYSVGGIPTTPENWFEILNSRRRLMKAIVCN